MRKRHECTAEQPCGQPFFRDHCDGCGEDVHSRYPVPPNQGVLQLTDAQRSGQWTYWCQPCAVHLLPAAVLPEEWRGQYSGGWDVAPCAETDPHTAHVWRGAASYDEEGTVRTLACEGFR